MILLRVLVLVGVMLNSEQLLAQNYRYQEQDAFNFVSSDGEMFGRRDGSIVPGRSALAY